MGVKGFRNLPGVQLANVENLSLLDLAPGGHIGRFCIWTRDAFEKLDSLFGTYEESATMKKGFSLPRTAMSNADLTRIINSDEIQSVIKPSNGLKNKNTRNILNPAYAGAVERAEAKKKLD